MRLHHIAYVCADVESKAGSLCSLLGCRQTGGVVADKNQGVKIIFLDFGGEPQLELMEPLGPQSPVRRHLEKGGGLYHLCFEVDDLEKTLERVQKEGKAMVVKVPARAPAIGNKRVAFVVTNERDLVEFVEMEKK